MKKRNGLGIVAGIWLVAACGVSGAWADGKGAIGPFDRLRAGEGVPGVAGGFSAAGPRPMGGSVARVDMAALREMLAKAPAERLGARLVGETGYGLRIALPAPDEAKVDRVGEMGGMIECRVAESMVMAPELAARFPGIKTYIVQSEDGTMSGRLEVTQRGVTGMLRGVAPGRGMLAAATAGSRVWMLDPWQSGDPGHVVSYWLTDLPGQPDFACETTVGAIEQGGHGFGVTLPKDEEGAFGGATGGTGESGTRGGGSSGEEVAPRGGSIGGGGGGGGSGVQMLRTFRLAMACTGEYGVYHSTIQGNPPNAADPLAAIVTVVSRTNVVYEADLAVRFLLVANNDQIVFFDPVTDPYPTTCDGSGGANCSGGYLTPNITTINMRIGLANYDIGHLVTRVVGGVAFLSSTCGANKAGGISGIPRGGDVDPFAALVVVHEIGHQMGANHTFSGIRGRCGNNANLPTAWEAGGGSSPMAYPGACPVGGEPPSDNVVVFADPFFHHGSLNEMQTFLANQTCAVSLPSANRAPVLQSTTANTAIPPGTPFVLSAVATDADNDVLMYSWEQRDNGFARPLSGDGAFDNGQGALFRIFPPVLSSERTFPRMSDVLAGVATPGEMLPTVTGVVRRFRVVVRDNSPGVGGTAIRSSNLEVSIAAGTTPFGVVSPGAMDFWSGGAAMVAWTVGGTDAALISCSEVAIRLSLDNGATFPIDLGTHPNTGTATVSVPGNLTTTGRVRIDAVNRIFFAVSRPFGLHAECIADRNHDGAINSQDFLEFTTAFFEGSLSADFDHDGVINSTDFFEFLTALFEAC